MLDTNEVGAGSPDRGNASDWCPVSSLPIPTRVVLLTGPSGSGKSSLAARTGLPVLRLDDFYKEAGDPTLPLVPGTTDTDWDSPLSWDADAAVAAIAELCATGRTAVPVYDIATSSLVGRESLDIARTPLFVAEGIFAADIVSRCQELGLLADALCLRGRPSTTFRRRLLRDLREGRKSVPVLLRRGWRLMRTERAIVARQTALGAHPCAKGEALGRLAAAAAGRHRAPTALATKAAVSVPAPRAAEQTHEPA
ncbi:uridine kinase [Streptomyces sp. NPDC046887]|uniref:uridine kinase n=1 Tax=Streptomyces sp. NPDC046887 TaxID=3155472 RepID=UPI003401D14C